MDEKAAKALREPFPEGAIGKLPKGGVMLSYVGHAAVTDRLLAVDPDWSWEPFALTEEGLPAVDKSGNLWIRLTVCGVTRPGVGDGKNAKECISDAIRNAAMRFGVALDLWAKEDLSGDGDAPPNPPPPPAAPTAKQLADEHDTLARTWGKLEDDFDPAKALSERVKKRKDAEAEGDATPYKKWLAEQIGSYKTLITEREAQADAQEKFPIPDAAKAAA